MEFIDLNRHGEIGSNSTFLSIGSFNILIDSGLHPKKLGKDSLPDFNQIQGKTIDLIILTHCHLDHLGSLPIIARSHPEAPILTSLPNLSLAPRMLRNSINVMKRQREEYGMTDYPLYVHRDIDHVKLSIIALPFEKSEFLYKNKDKIEIKLHPSGHVVGASAIEIIYKSKRIVHTGDVLFEAQRTLPGAYLPNGKIDTLFLETTRGATVRAKESTRENEIKHLIDSINEILDQDGTCLIPVFALGRMQELFKIILESMQFGILRKAPVYSTGLGMDICNYFDKISNRTGLINFDLKILKQLDIKTIDPKLRPGKNIKKKGIYIVSSGMLVERTPSYNVAASLLNTPTNGIFFIGYCDPDTPGGQLLENKDAESFYFNAFDYLSPIRASIKKFDLSGHADRDSLVEYAVQARPDTIVLTHGENEARNWFQQSLNQHLPNTQIIDPIPGQTYPI